MKKHYRILGVLFLVILLAYLDKPDRGGYPRCEELSEVYLRDLTTRRIGIWSWKLFEDPRFRFHMPVSNFDALKARTDTLGFDEWFETDGGHFGSFNETGGDSNELYYTKKYERGKSCLIYYRPQNERLDVIIFYH